MTSRRSFLGAIAAALVLDPERALWVPGAKKIFLPPAPAIVRPMFNVGDVVVFGDDPQRFVCMESGNPKTGLGASFAFLSGRGLPWGMRIPNRFAPALMMEGRKRDELGRVRVHLGASGGARSVIMGA